MSDLKFKENQLFWKSYSKNRVCFRLAEGSLTVKMVLGIGQIM